MLNYGTLKLKAWQGREMKIGIVVEDTGLSNIDFSNVEKGNPGVGGTVFEEILLTNSLAMKKGIEIVLYVSSLQNKYNKKLLLKEVNDRYDIPSFAKSDGVDILLFCTGKNSKWYEEIEKSSIKSIAWAHGFLNYYELKDIRKNPYVKRVVFVGRNMYSSYIADDIIKKSTYIYNMYCSDYCPIRTEYKHDVCYLGALNRYKGFHVLAKAWPIVLEKVPDAKLYVIGRGDLYNRNSSLGKFGIAEKKYEASFIKYLTDKKGMILPSVKFLGNLGEEKKQIISKMSVGVVNPTAITETFCISAIEINACGVPVCTKGEFGLLDTVIDKKNGLFSKNYLELANNIIKLLKNSSLNGNMQKMALSNAKRFTPLKLIPDWIKLFDDVNQNRNVQMIKISSSEINCVKRILYRIRIQKGISVIPSFIRFEYFLKHMGRVYFRDMLYHYIQKGE